MKRLRNFYKKKIWSPEFEKIITTRWGSAPKPRITNLALPSSKHSITRNFLSNSYDHAFSLIFAIFERGRRASFYRVQVGSRRDREHRRMLTPPWWFFAGDHRKRLYKHNLLIMEGAYVWPENPSNPILINNQR